MFLGLTAKFVLLIHRNGAIGLLRYAAVLASGGDAHLSSGSVLVSDSIDAEMVVSDPTIDSDGHIIDNLLGKLVSDKFFEGSDLRSTSITQLTTAFRILAFISEDPVRTILFLYLCFLTNSI